MAAKSSPGILLKMRTEDQRSSHRWIELLRSRIGVNHPQGEYKHKKRFKECNDVEPQEPAVTCVLLAGHFIRTVEVNVPLGGPSLCNNMTGVLGLGARC